MDKAAGVFSRKDSGFPMVFSSLVFLCIFLPVVFGLYLLVPGIRAKNILLLLASIVFYAYGEPVYVLLLIASAFLNYLWARLLDGKKRGSRAAKTVLALCVLQNLGILVVFKYAAFLVGLINAAGASIPVPVISLPIGISFFTFQAMSYVIDVYRGEVKAQKSFVRVLLYISFFPQLIAGPIVKYHDIERELSDRKQSPDEVAQGVRRFACGLGKKVLIANTVAAIADTLFAAETGQINVLSAWLGAIAYMLQIYFDFSGYSDMAIGLGQMFGFHFKENFIYPYAAVSIRDFWRRWHISLSSWFKEYLYIPLGGNRKGRARTSVNKVLVFACTGIWHGANATFLFWGLYHGFFLMLEDAIPGFRWEGGWLKKAFGHLYLLLVVLIGFVFFRADTMGQGLAWVGQMFAGLHFENSCMRLLLAQLTPLHITALLAGSVLAMPVLPIGKRIPVLQRVSYAGALLILVLCLIRLAGGTYNPFIYFRF